jgi:alpha-beta hydrolase superfamily lysophospholipase
MGSNIFGFFKWALALVGVFAFVLSGMLAIPLKSPPPLASIHTGAQAIGHEARPELSRFQARDNTWLAYRLYPAKNGASDRLVVLAHGSSASSDEMHMVARALAENGVTAVAIDVRGHGASGTRGDIAYIGQLDDDMTDLVGELRKSYADAQLTLIGHSAGGGFALRIAAGPVGTLFDRFVLLAPYLGHSAPTNRPAEKASLWAEPDIPRILALTFLRLVGIDWPQSLPVIAFANAPEAAKLVTSRYSFRLLTDYGPPADWQGALRKTAARIDVIAGESDELMDAAAYKSVLPPLGVHVALLPNVDHMGIVYQPAALAAILETTLRRRLTQG